MGAAFKVALDGEAEIVPEGAAVVSRLTSILRNVFLWKLRKMRDVKIIVVRLAVVGTVNVTDRFPYVEHVVNESRKRRYRCHSTSSQLPGQIKWQPSRKFCMKTRFGAVSSC